MTNLWIALLTTAGIVLVVDLVTTYLRKRARRASAPKESSPAEKEPGSQSD
jgi:hypothetical protein